MKRAALATACAATAAAWLCQFFLVHYKFAGDWTALYYTGAYTRTPPALANEQIYRFPTGGFDGQFDHFIAHDPWMRRDTARFVDNPRLRWRRILVPALAWTVALGQSDFVDSAYDAVLLAFVFLGTYWLGRFLDAPAWGAAFLLVPAVLISLERGTLDLALAALCIAFAWYATRQSPIVYAVLALAPLARETGLCLTAAFVAVELWHKSWRAAALATLTLAPFAAWTLFLNAHTARDQTTFASVIPLQGLLQRTLHPLPYAVTSNWLKKAAALDYLAVLGIWIALIFVARYATRKPAPLPAAALAFAAVAVFLAQPQAWGDAYTFARTMSPLLILAALIALRDRRWWGLVPLAAALPRILFQLLTVLKSA